MDSKNLSRRDFIKLISLMPFLYLDKPQFSTIPPQEKKQLEGNQNSPNIIILVFDALSAKNMSIYGYPRDTTPNISKFARQATVFHNHYAAGNFTPSGTASLLTGAYPWHHRALQLKGRVAAQFQERNIFSHLPQEYQSIAYSHNHNVTILLRQFSKYLNKIPALDELMVYGKLFSGRLFPNDFTTAFWGEDALVGSHKRLSSSFIYSLIYRNQFLNTLFSQNENYIIRFPRGISFTSQQQIFFLEDAIDWIIEQCLSMHQPFLGYFHLWPPHDPYNTRYDFVDIFNDGWLPRKKPSHFFTEHHSESDEINQRRYYDEYIAYVDSEFDRLISSLERSGLMENSYIILTSDHGEMFERGIVGHSTPTLYEPLIRIPLIISKPEQKHREDIFTNTSCVDLLPTLLTINNRDIPDWCEGVVLPTFGDFTESEPRSIFAVEAKMNSSFKPLEKGTVAVIEEQYKLINYFGYEGYDEVYELYDLQNDPEEIENLYQSKIVLATQLKRKLADKIKIQNNNSGNN